MSALNPVEAALAQSVQQGFQHNQETIEQQAHQLEAGNAQIAQTMMNNQASLNAGWAQEAQASQGLDQIFQSLNTDHPGTVTPDMMGAQPSFQPAGFMQGTPESGFEHPTNIFQGTPEPFHDYGQHMGGEPTSGYQMEEVPEHAVIVEEVIILVPEGSHDGGHDNPFHFDNPFDGGDSHDGSEGVFHDPVGHDAF